MTRISQQHDKHLDQKEWQDLVNLKSEISRNPTAIGSDAMERFTELLVRSLEGKGDPPFNGQF